MPSSNNGCVPGLNTTVQTAQAAPNIFTPPKPTADKAAILAALAVLFEPDQVIELRAIHTKGRKRTDAGYFDSAHWPLLANNAVRLSNNGVSVYITLNTVDPQLLGRFNNRIQEFATATTSDQQIIRRRWLLIDLDPVRPSLTSATDLQLEAAHIKAQIIFKHLRGRGWSDPLVAKSGNGYHLLYAIDIPNDDDSTTLIKSVLIELAKRFDDALIKVDRSVFNAARICKLYGTVANKGDNTPSAPWRLSALLKTPARVLVTEDQLRMLSTVAPLPIAPIAPISRVTTNQNFTLEDFFARHGVTYAVDIHDGSERFKLATCPFNPEHINGEAAVFRETTGRLGFKCQHASCSDKNWKAVRELMDGAQPVKNELASVRVKTDDANTPDYAEEIIDTHRNAPRPDPACLYGLVGEIALAGSNNTEANPYAIAAAILAYLGTAFGRGPYMPIGDDWNHARLFIVHVGRSSRGRKGTAKKLIFRIHNAVKAIDEFLVPQVHRGGLSTREGLALMIHDGYMDGKTEVPAITDKRLLAVESEFANILHQSKRDGNTLSAALRDAWDGTSIRPAIKTSRVWASDPHIGIMGDVTPSELRDLMHKRELTNGFANRFIFFWAEGDKLLPFPQYTPKDVVETLASKVAQVLRFSGAERHVDKDVMRMEFAQDAASLYARLYKGELRERSAGEHITGLLDRRAPMLLRLAMIFALTDQTSIIKVEHINAAMSWVRYWVDSVKFIFQSAVDEAGAAATTETAQRIVSYLIEHEQATRTELSRSCFNGHVNKSTLDTALDELLSASPPAIEVEIVPRPNGQPGSPSKVYKPCITSSHRKDTANSANSAKCEAPSASAADIASERNVRSQRNDGGAELIHLPEFAHFADSAAVQNQPPTRVDIDTSQMGIPVDRDQSFRFLVTSDSGRS